MKVLARLLSQIDTWQCSNLMKCTLIWIRELKEINRLLSQMDILYKMMIQFWSRETMICDNVLQSGSTTSVLLGVWCIPDRFHPPGHRKPACKTYTSGCRDVISWCEIGIFEKKCILARLLHSFQLDRFGLQQQ